MFSPLIMCLLSAAAASQAGIFCRLAEDIVRSQEMDKRMGELTGNHQPGAPILIQTVGFLPRVFYLFTAMSSDELISLLDENTSIK